MKYLLRFCLFAVPFFLTSGMQAQVHPAGVGGSSIAVFGEFGASRPGQGAGFIYGPTIGGYLQTGHLLGLTARGSAYRFGSPSVKVYEAFVGPRVAVHVPFFTAYGEVLGGLGHSGYQKPAPAIGYSTGWGPAWQIDGGVDHGVLPHLQWRVAELAYGEIYTGPTVSQTSISTGLVITLF